MKILTVDIGTGTQDIFLYDSLLDLENGLKLVLPSPTMMVHHQLKEATRRREAVLLTGTIMGGGPSQWAAEAHIRAGLPVYATPQAALTFNDELEVVQAMGVQIVSPDEAGRLPASVRRLELRDFDFLAIERALAVFGVSLKDMTAAAVAVFDHGNSPPGYSDRQFRFDYLDRRIREHNRLSAFAYKAEDVPAILTRLRAVVASTQGLDAPLVVMDTAPAAVLGATFDPRLAGRERLLVANVGNFHTLAFRLRAVHERSREAPQWRIEGVFEHHTGLIDRPRLETLLLRLADGSLKHAEVFGEQGHGALVYEPEPLRLGEGDFDVAVTGPRRSLLKVKPDNQAGSGLRVYLAVPFGDMMIAGCFGLLAATADVLSELGETLRGSLFGRGGSGAAPWDVDEL